MAEINRQGQFEVIDSFAITRKGEFYLIGKVIEGEIKEGWYLKVPLSGSLSLSVKINALEEVEISSELSRYTLAIINGEEENMSLLLGLNIGSEILDISIEGTD